MDALPIPYSPLPTPRSCPHHTLAHNRFTTCSLVPGVFFAGPGMPGHVCGACVPCWIDGQPPTAETLTPVLLEAMQRRGMATAPKISGTQPAGRMACIHLGAATGKGDCCGGREYSCEHPAHRITNLRYCQSCGDWEG